MKDELIKRKAEIRRRFDEAVKERSAITAQISRIVTGGEVLDELRARSRKLSEELARLESELEQVLALLETEYRQEAEAIKGQKSGRTADEAYAQMARMMGRGKLNRA